MLIWQDQLIFALQFVENAFFDEPFRNMTKSELNIGASIGLSCSVTLRNK